MSARNTVTFYLHPKLRRRAEQGNHNFIAKVGEVLKAAGFAVAYDNDDKVARLRAMARSGFSLFLMQDPVNKRGLVMRKTYLYPFWHIEKEAARWDWPVAQETFAWSPDKAQVASNFYRFWRQRQFGDAAFDTRRDGFVYVPLQSQLLRKRSFQACSPIDMIKAVLAHDPDRQVMLTLHPNETYSPEENAALEALLAQHDRLFLEIGDMERYLQTCDYVVTQNSSAGFLANFFAKPVVLFARADFHHIALNVHELGAQQALSAADDHRPDYAGYLHWFLQENAINAGRSESHDAIRAVLRGHNWPV